MEEENSLSQAPQGRGAELVATRAALGDVVVEAGAHMMNLEVGIRADTRAAQRCCYVGYLGVAESRGMAHRAPDRAEQRLTLRYRGGAPGNGRRRYGWREQPHEHGECHHVAGYL